MKNRPLPPSVALYLQQDGAGDESVVGQVFTADAEVHDEGRTLRGHDAIRAWRREVRARYRYRIEPLDWSSDEAQRLQVKVRVTGDFPGSPVVLDYRIVLSDGRVAELRIG